MLHMEQGRQMDGWTCCIVVVVGVETVTDWLSVCLTLWRMIPLERSVFLLPVKKFPVILCSLEGQHLFPNSLKLAHIPGQFLPFHSFPTPLFFFAVYVNIIRASASRFEVLLPFKTLYAFLFSHVHAICFTQLTSLIVLHVNGNRSIECGPSVPVGDEAPALLSRNPYLWQWLICRMNPALCREFWTWPSTSL